MVKILCAAIQFKLSDSTEFIVVTGRSHADCIQVMAGLGYYRRDRFEETQGFMVSDGDSSRFVDRIEAMEIAKASGQLKDYVTGKILYSEFVNY